MGRELRSRRNPTGGGASQLDSAAAGGEGEPSGPQIVETVELPEASGEGSGSDLVLSSEKQPSSEGQASAEAPLANETPKPITGEVRADGLVYRVLPDGASVALVGWYGEAPSGDVSVPASVSSGSDSFAVTAIGVPGADGSSDSVFFEAPAASLSVPASVESIAGGALSRCPTLSRVSVSTDNESYASFDGMLFSKDLTSLLLVPEGKEGAARIPDPATSVPAGALSRAPGLSGAEVGEGNASFASWNGMLCTKDMKTLVACPIGAGDAVVIPEGVESIGSGAFAGCAVASLTALGFAREIAADAFDAEARAGAVVALPAGDDYDERKAVWKAAGFENFKEPAKPGDVSTPQPTAPEGEREGAQASGLAFEVLDDYTLAVSWQGSEGPEGDLEIPATAEVGGVSYRVSAIAPAGFAGCSGLTGATLPASVTSIGDRAFEATGIAEVWLPASVATVGERAFAACPSLSRIVALGSPWVADSALAECSGVSVYAPSDSANPWNVGLPAAGNHLMPYGVQLLEEPLQLEVGQSAILLESGDLQAPEPVEVSYAYAAKPLSVEPDGTATGKAEGSSEVAVSLSLDGVELARASRAAEVAAASGAYVLARTFAAAEEVSAEVAPPAREGQVFTLWYADEACTKRVDYSKPLAEQAAKPDGGYALYGKYEDGSIEGDLPTVNNVGKARWSLTDAGTLYIRAEAGAVIADFGYVQKDGFTPSEGFWSPHRGLVKKVSMALGMSAASTVYWFAGMKSLSDIMETYIPAKAVDIGRMYDDDGKITKLPDDYTVPEGVEKAQAVFRGCSLEAIPEGFRFPCTIRDVNSFFGGNDFVSIPEGLALPESLESVRWLFSGCANLVSLPKGFALPTKKPLLAGYLFSNCPSLASLPEDFTVPGNVTNIECMFIKCPSLSVLPDGFSVPAGLVGEMDRLFYCELADGQPRAPLYYGGSDATLLGLDYESQNRSLVADTADLAEWGMRQVRFQVQKPDEEAGFPWETRMVAWTDKQGMLFDPGTLQLDEYGFTGWFVDEKCLEPADFTKPLPEGVTELYGKWIEHGGRCTAEGDLPVKDGIGSAWWSITVDGVLSLQSEGDAVVSICWRPEETKPNTGFDTTYWGPYRSEVKGVLMSPGFDTLDMGMWFRDMGGLTELDEGFFIPKSCTYVGYLLERSGIDRLPEAFSRFGECEQVQYATCMVTDCAKLTELPAGFNLPKYMKSANYMFSRTGLESLPDGFELPDGLDNPRGMFFGCKELRYLPEDLSIPSSVTTVRLMFGRCDKLTSIPGGLLEALSPEARETVNSAGGMFTVDADPSGKKLMTYFPAATQEEVDYVDWNAQNREVSRVNPANRHLVAMLLPDESGAYDVAKPYATLLADEGGIVAEPVAPVRPGKVFAGWFADAQCQNAFDFSQPLAAETTLLYAKYQASSGELPTVGGGFDASWSFSNGALTVTCNAPGATIDDLGLMKGDAQPGYWNFLRDQVTSVIVDPSVKALSMDGWFRNMPNLTDIARAAVPSGTKSAKNLFDGCLKLSDIPSGYAFPDGLENMMQMFRNCKSLETLPAGFALPEGVLNASGFLAYTPIRALPASFVIPEGMTDASWMFTGCADLASLPDGFDIPKSVGTVAHMFSECGLTSLPSSFLLKDGLKNISYLFFSNKQLTALPAGFKIPETVLNAQEMFSKCDSLAALPEGFTFEGDVAKTSWMFSECTSLRALPEGFALPRSSESIKSMFAKCFNLRYLPASFDLSTLAPELRTHESLYDLFYMGSVSLATVYYGGSDLSKLAPEGADAKTYWNDNYRRTLVNDEASLDPGALLVEFKTKAEGEDGWTTQRTLMSDADGKVPELQADSRYGYRFGGWCVDETCLAPVQFSDSLASLDADGDRTVTLYGIYTLRLSAEIPLAAKVTVQASGNVIPAKFDIVSGTPKTLVLKQVVSEAAGGASKLIPSAGELDKVKLDITLGDKSTSLGIGGSSPYVGVADAATEGKPSVLEGSIGVSLNGAQIDYQPGDDVTSFAKLEWTVEAVL